MDIQTSDLSELFAASVARERPVPRVCPFVRRQVTRAGELATAIGANVH